MPTSLDPTWLVNETEKDMSSRLRTSTVFAIFLGVMVTAACSTVDRTDNNILGEEVGVKVTCLNGNQTNTWWEVGSCGPGCQQPVQKHESVQVCAAPATIDPSFDPIEDYDYGGTEENQFPEWDDDIRSLCTTRCDQLNDDNVGTSNCDDTRWTAHTTRPIPLQPPWTPEDPLNCHPDYFNHSLIADPHANSIDWNQGVGTPLNLPLGCSLAADCKWHFDADVDAWTLGFDAGSVLSTDPLDPDARQADYHSVSGTTGTYLTIDMGSGSGHGYDDTHDIDGHAEYSAANCGDDTCPFYLATFEAQNATDSWNVWLKVSPLVDEPKLINGVHIGALQCTYAVWRPSTGQVAFFPGSLVLRAEFEVDSTCNSCTGFADGAHAVDLVNEEVVFGAYDPTDGSFYLDYTFPLPGGEGNLVLDLAVDGHPPVAAIDLDLEVACNNPYGYLLSNADSASTDVDSDLDALVWYVDGIARATGYVMPIGVHVVDLMAIDSRGARRRAGERRLEVVRGERCL